MICSDAPSRHATLTTTNDELLVGNTGSFEVINSFSSVEYFYGSPTGYNGTPDHTLESIVSGQLLGMVIACVGDVNGDSYEDHLLTEPFNSTQAFGGSMLWLYYGTTGALPNEADLKYAPSINNARVGEDIVPAGETSMKTVTTTCSSAAALETQRVNLKSSLGLPPDFRRNPNFSHRATVANILA